MVESKILSLEEINKLARRVLFSNGANEETSRVLADVIMTAERDGHANHGFKQLPSYVASISGGWADGQAVPVIEAPTTATLRVDGANGYAQIALERISNRATEMARLNGCTVLALRNIHHIGPLGPDIEPFAQQGLCALTFVNTLALMVPWQGSVAAFGTNPMAFACPRPDGPPIVWDQASSVISKAKIGHMQSQGVELDEVAGLDANGVPTRDPETILKSKQLLPFAKHKGTAIALMVEILAAAMTGGSLAVRERPDDEPEPVSKDCGQLVIVIDPDIVCGKDFAESLNPLLNVLNGNGTARIPGDGRLAHRAQTLASGVEVSTSLLADIEELTKP